MRNIIYILAVFALCFGFKAQAQNYEVVLLKDKLKTLQTFEKEKLEYLIFGTPALLILNDNPTYAWNKGKDIETVDVSMPKMSLMTNNIYGKDFGNAKLLILRFEEGDIFQLKENQLDLFQNLQYVVIRYHISISEQEIVNRIINLKLNNSLKDLVFLLDPNNGTDEEI